MSSDTSEIFILDTATCQTVSALLHEQLVDQNIIDWKIRWQPILLERLSLLHAQGRPMSTWPPGWHWQWDQKVAGMDGLLGLAGFAVTCEQVTQGMMRIDLTKSAVQPAHLRKPLVYIDYLETAPWNRPDVVPNVTYRGVGTALMMAAIARSVEEGFSGRVGLHSLPQAESFYLHKLKMMDFGPDAKYSNMRYFELAPEQAMAILDEENLL